MILTKEIGLGIFEPYSLLLNCFAIILLYQRALSKLFNILKDHILKRGDRMKKVTLILYSILIILNNNLLQSAISTADKGKEHAEEKIEDSGETPQQWSFISQNGNCIGIIQTSFQYIKNTYDELKRLHDKDNDLFKQFAVMNKTKSDEEIAQEHKKAREDEVKIPRKIREQIAQERMKDTSLFFEKIGKYNFYKIDDEKKQRTLNPIFVYLLHIAYDPINNTLMPLSDILAQKLIVPTDTIEENWSITRTKGLTATVPTNIMISTSKKEIIDILKALQTVSKTDIATLFLLAHEAIIPDEKYTLLYTTLLSDKQTKILVDESSKTIKDLTIELLLAARKGGHIDTFEELRVTDPKIGVPRLQTEKEYVIQRLHAKKEKILLSEEMDAPEIIFFINSTPNVLKISWLSLKNIEKSIRLLWKKNQTLFSKLINIINGGYSIENLDADSINALQQAGLMTKEMLIPYKIQYMIQLMTQKEDLTTGQPLVLKRLKTLKKEGLIVAKTPTGTSPSLSSSSEDDK